MDKKNIKLMSSLFLPLVIAFLNVFMILFPRDILEASKNGLSLWFNNVLPSLLPFIIGTNILAKLGFISFLGTLLEPIMLPLFNVPGCGGYALATGILSGYPMGAKTVASLCEKNELTKTEAQRLIAFCNNSGPLFMLGAVGNGMFHSLATGYFIMICHYISAFITGILFKKYKSKEKTKPKNYKNLFYKAIKHMKTARDKEGLKFGEILLVSVKNSMETITIVGGFIIFFCVLVKILEITQITIFLANTLSPFLNFFQISEDIFKGLVIGFIEITNGCNVLAQQEFSKAQLVITVFVITFGGLSIFAQSASFISKTEINPFVFFLSKLIQASISSSVAFLIFPLFDFTKEVVAVYTPYTDSFFSKLSVSTSLFFLSLFSLMAIIIISNIITITNKRKY